MDKRFLFTGIILVLCAAYVVADGLIQTSVGDISLDPAGGDVLVDGNLGVGAVSPATPLHIEDTVNPQLRVGYSGAYYMDVGHGGNFDVVGGSNDYRFSYGGSEKVRFTHDGKVGIGTTSPSEALVVQKSGASRVLIQGPEGVNTEADLKLISRYAPSTTHTWDLNANDDNDWLRLYYNSNLKMTVDGGSGDVGIGFASPSQKLDVNGNVRADSFIEYSPVYVGEALSKLEKIKPVSSSEEGDWAEVDHDTLPEGVKVLVKEKWLRDKETGEEARVDDVLGGVRGLLEEANKTVQEEAVDLEGNPVKVNKTEIVYRLKSSGKEYGSIDDYIQEHYTEFEKTVPGRDLGKMLQVTVKAVMELKEENDALKAENNQIKTELCKKDGSYKFCK